MNDKGMKVTMKQSDAFWEADLDEIEATFLVGKKITDLKVRLDNRVPPQGHVALGRTVDVDKAVARLLDKQKKDAKPTSLMGRLFDRVIFG
jgi:hypothetical protein